MEVAVRERAADEMDARYALIDLFQLAKETFVTGLPDNSRPVPPEWKGKASSTQREWVALRSRKVIAEDWQRGKLRPLIAIPFDETMNWVDSQVLGREVTFARSTETKKR